MRCVASLLALLLSGISALAQYGTTAPSVPIDGKMGPQGAPGPQGAAGQTGATGAVGPAGAPKRIERYTAPANTSGVATFTWPACTGAADVDVITGWVTINGLVQMVTGAVVTQSLSGATANVKVSQGTLALTASPFTTAPQGTNLTVRMMCN